MSDRRNTPARLSRREFLRGVARAAAGGALAAAAVTMYARGRRRAAERCVNGGICSGCEAFGRCGLPAALSAKRAGRRP